MPNSHRKLLLALGIIMISASNGWAADEADYVPMVSGGIGTDDMNNLLRIQNQYNLKLLFTENNGVYLSDLAVQITDSQHNVVANTRTDGPVLLVKLPRGTYHVEAREDDAATREAKVTVSDNSLHTYQMRFPTRDPDAKDFE